MASDYVPPAPGEPLDAGQQALVKLWVKIITDEIRAELAAAANQHDQHHTEPEGAALDDGT